MSGQSPMLSPCLQFPIGPGSEGPMAAMSAMEPHHVNGSLGEWKSLLPPRLLPARAHAPLAASPHCQPACLVEASRGALSPPRGGPLSDGVCPELGRSGDQTSECTDPTVHVASVLGFLAACGGRGSSLGSSDPGGPGAWHRHV
ncbi:hypothetical protein P7K49_033647 [Saguinus oedipus]|uniref:Uncharacterized protein n=1 Tax=Saguinus oedipus TaxID=9490 RepID=A0ABQ9TSH3_SAGOE|nr:hypothetical protein P7K49_033647 [Saguinus oedipus]